MDSDEFVQFMEPYIHDLCAQILVYMESEMDKCGKRDWFLEVLQRELEDFFVRTSFPDRLEQIHAENKTIYWAIGRDFEFAGWNWIDGEPVMTYREDGPIRRSLQIIKELYLTHEFPMNTWFEIWYGSGSVKFLVREGRKTLLHAPSWLESAVLLLERKFNEYYLETEEETARKLVSGDNEIYVSITQTKIKDKYSYTCSIEEPRGTMQCYLPRQKSIVDMVLTLCHDYPRFEDFIRHHRFVEARVHALHGEKNDGFVSLAELWQRAQQRMAEKRKEHQSGRD